MIEQDVISGVEMVFKREFTCWQRRVCDKRYDCSVTGLEGGSVRVVLDEAVLEIGANVAGELAFCLSEAMSISANSDVFTSTAAVRENGLLETHYRLFLGMWQFRAAGVVDFINANFWVTCEEENKTEIAIFAYFEGFAIDFEETTYYFSREDASWLQEKLLLASSQVLNVSSQRFLLVNALINDSPPAWTKDSVHRVSATDLGCSIPPYG